MNNKEDYKEERFDAFVNKTIKMTSRNYFIKQAKITNREKKIINDENYADILNYYADITMQKTNELDTVENKMQLDKALNCLSEIEQAVLFLLFNEELSQSEAAEILELYSKTVSKIKIRAIAKLKKYMNGDGKNEE